MTDNFNQAFQKLEQEMHTEAQLLDSKKAEHKKLLDDVLGFKAENAKQKIAIQTREKQISDNETKAKRLESEIRHIEEDQRKKHLELSRINNLNEERLKEHGVKLPHH